MYPPAIVEPPKAAPLLPHHPLARWLILVALFGLALALRLSDIGSPPLDFNPTRQYRAALIARWYYLEGQPGVPQGQREVARANYEHEGILEPPVMEWLAALAYRVAGGEHLWLPRALSVLFWLTGGVALYLLAAELSTPDTALFSTAFYLLLPFGVAASRSVQPDPLMVTLMLLGWYFILTYHARRSTARLLAAAVVSACALLVKPVAVFFLFGAFLSLSVWRLGLRRTVEDRGCWLFTAVSLLPSLGYYVVYGLVVGDTLRAQADLTFLPALLAQAGYWTGWFLLIGKTVGFTAFIGAALGCFLFAPGPARALLGGLWCGYVGYGLVFTFHIFSHDYYHLPLIPIVALSLGPLAAVVLDSLAQRAQSARHTRYAVLMVFVLATLLAALQVRVNLLHPDFARTVRTAEEVGAAVGHSSRTVFLSFAYGKPLAYHGELAGVFWPTTWDLQEEARRGQRVPTAWDRLDALRSGGPLDYFIVTDLDEWEKQGDLRNVLLGTFPVLVQTETFIVFDLTGDRSGAGRLP